MTAKQKFRILDVFRYALKMFEIMILAIPRIKGTPESTINTSNLGSPLLTLPNELLFLIAGFLEAEYQLSLRICCRQFRLLLSDLDPALSDVKTRLRFYKCLEPDYPDYLPCPTCGIMFKWRSVLMWTRCPREGQHHSMPNWNSAIYECWYLSATTDIRMSSPFIESVFRAHERGERYGYPVSSLRSRGLHRRGFLFQNDVRMIDGELVLATRWELDAEVRMNWEDQVRLLFRASCLHWRSNGWHDKVPALLKGASMNMRPLKPAEVVKCSFCECDWQLQISHKTDTHLRIVYYVWKNYGRRYGKRQGNEQIFYREPAPPLDIEAVSQRDLRALFESGNEERSNMEGTEIC
ncbi:hypothetical protein PV10_03436 [Exophiala mesophila]|uniref:F-box domain-containing protein n=1 Tax=Exophiala mesophila TaxID=212818 RepID=A0A0D1X217_EXOME|nr:uncharacterized protein PV10_03436 [Exophiala mesophila]KIV95830.1 hypothetical protein PV10_03436 [Exophiala mesophila]